MAFHHIRQTFALTYLFVSEMTQDRICICWMQISFAFLVLCTLCVVHYQKFGSIPAYEQQTIYDKSLQTKYIIIIIICSSPILPIVCQKSRQIEFKQLFSFNFPIIWHNWHQTCTFTARHAYDRIFYFCSCYFCSFTAIFSHFTAYFFHFTVYFCSKFKF